jgi:bisphosphoglycerate-independent phosphoglycerate mutase (AlkP superfamily)
MCRQQSEPLFTVDDLYDGRGITAEITQDVWRDRLSIEIEPISIETAANRMIRTAQSYDVVMYEYYLTDKAGHEMDFSMAEQVVQRLDTFLGCLYRAISKEDLIIVTSDHGNIEDLSIKTHTRNPVPLIVLGKHAEKFSQARSITDVIPTLIELSA